MTFTYSENPNPRPDISHFTADDGQIGESDDEGEDRDVLTTSVAAVGGEGRTVTLTFTNASAIVTLPGGLQLRGYSSVLNNIQAVVEGEDPDDLFVVAR